MILAIDIGNSRVKAGVQINGKINFTAVDTDPYADARSYLDKLDIDGEIDAVILSSVVDELCDTFQEISNILSGSDGMFVDHRVRTGIELKVDHPEQVGPDRIANAVGGNHVAGGAVIVVDMGSATTFTVVGRDRQMLGGCIMPGVNMMATALSEKTSKLPLVEIAIPEGVIGKNTVENIHCGLSYGVAGAVERVVAEIKKEIGYTMKVILTGGSSTLFKDLIYGIDIVDPLLTLKGLFVISELHKE
jgi:type III pantothenate kinase